MMIGSYPRTPGRINGGVAAAMMYLSGELARTSGIELIGVRIAKDEADASDASQFDWTIVDLPLGRLSLSTLYGRQRKRLAELVARYNPDILHAQGADIAGFLAVRSTVPSVITIHGLLAECARFQSNPVERARATLAAAVTERSTVLRATDLIAISPYVTAYYADGIRGRVHDVPNPVAASYFEMPRAPEPGRFLYAGRIANGKGLVELIQAYASVRQPHWSLVLAGATPDSAYEGRLRSLTAALGVSASVHFRGLLDEATLMQEFSVAQSLVLPSFQETAPMVVQQAMAAGLAVVATKVGGIPFQVDHGTTGLLFDAGDAVALGRHLKAVGDDPQLARELGAAAKVAAEARYRAGVVADATAAVYRGILERSGSRISRASAT